MIVADAGPIIAFARVGRLALLQQIVTELVVPHAVYEDLVIKGRGRPGAAEVERSTWMRRLTIRDQEALAHLPRVLGRGEREAIVLAGEEHAMLLADDWKARETAEQRGIEVVGILWVLVEAKRRGLIAEVRSIVEELLAVGYWIHGERVIQPFLQEMGEHEPMEL